jgi:hypothetical protein
VAQAPDDAVDRLYGLPREDFVGERDALAKKLRADGRREEAAAVKALGKPTVAAWAANQAVRSQKKTARELWKAGDELSRAHEAVVAGKGSGAKLREATERERAAVERLVDAARGLLSASGGDLSEATIERVRETLHAGAIDPAAREEVAGGRSARERTPQGLFGGAADVFAVQPARTRAATAEPKAKPKGDDPAAGRRERAEAAARRREEAASRKREREQAAARERELKAAMERVDKAQRALAQAEERSARAAERLEEARATEREAGEALADARAELRAAEGR